MLFLYCEVLGRKLPWFGDVVPGRQPKWLPVVLSQAEVRSDLAQLDGEKWLMASLLHGVGLRLMECLRRRVKDMDLARNEITVRDSKDRVTVLPASLKASPASQLAKVKVIHDQDLCAGFGCVFPPRGALDRKYLSASASWAWQYVFLVRGRFRDPCSGDRCRHHVHESVLQLSVREAALPAGVTKLVSCHIFRHAFATHLPEDGYDIRMVQELLGRADAFYDHDLHARPEPRRTRCQQPSRSALSARPAGRPAVIAA